MFWAGETYSTRRTQSNNPSNLKFNNLSIESGQSSPQMQKDNLKDGIE